MKLTVNKHMPAFLACTLHSIPETAGATFLMWDQVIRLLYRYKE